MNKLNLQFTEFHVNVYFDNGKDWESYFNVPRTEYSKTLMEIQEKYGDIAVIEVTGVNNFV